jgi:hypothetical protein
MNNKHFDNYDYDIKCPLAIFLCKRNIDRDSENLNMVSKSVHLYGLNENHPKIRILLFPEFDK